MSFSVFVSRLTEYYRRHGVVATLQRAGSGVKRTLFAGRMVVFYCDLTSRKLRPMNPPAGCCVRRIRSLSELGSDRFQEMTSFWNPELARQNVRERFERQASLWLVESDSLLAGFGWTIEGTAIEPYYFPLGGKDVQLFDFYISPKFRGGTLYWLLTNHILCTLAAEGCARAFADTGEWNRAQLAAFQRTPFRPLGSVTTYKLFGRAFTSWSATEPVANALQKTGKGAKAAIMLRPNE
ncbi:MAG TPA: GNAT family N-acetyltransferase [Terriglobales bacterium]|nr:GNAT family N-acetyltransferase [Terriglobales bacterium]